MLMENGRAEGFSRRRPRLTIGPLGPGPWAHLKSAWRNRYAFPTLCYHALAVTYRSTILGWWWLVIRATIPTLGLIVIFQHIGSLQPKTLPYPLHVISGMILWTILGIGLAQGTRRMRLVRRITSRLALPKVLGLAAGMALPCAYALGFLFLMVGGVTYYYVTTGKVYIGTLAGIVSFPISILLTGALTLGILSLTSVLFLAAKDVRMVVNILIPSWFYFTPIIYPLNVLPETWGMAVMTLNPMAPLVEFGRWALLGAEPVHPLYLLTSSLSCLTIFWLGLGFIARAEIALPLLPSK